MRDSGLGSLGSESDTSPSQGNMTAVSVSVNIDDTSLTQISPGPSSLLAAVDVMTGTLRNVAGKKFLVTYVGQSVLDRRYTQPQFWKCFVPWLVSEVKRNPSPQNVTLQVHAAGSYMLKGYADDPDKPIFEHKLQQLSKFSRIHRDIKCFVYLTKGFADMFTCHVYKAPEEKMVSLMCEKYSQLLA